MPGKSLKIKFKPSPARSGILGKGEPVPRKVGERLPKTDAEGQRRYDRFVKPCLKDLRKMAERHSQGNEAIADAMLADAVLKIVAAVGKEHVQKPKNYALRVAKNAMNSLKRQEDVQRKLVELMSLKKLASKTKNLFAKHGMTRTQLPPRPEILKLVKRLLAKAKISPAAKETFAYYVGLRDGKIKTYQQTARHFNISRDTVGSHIHRVRKELRRLVDLEKQRNYFPG